LLGLWQPHRSSQAHRPVRPAAASRAIPAGLQAPAARDLLADGVQRFSAVIGSLEHQCRMPVAGARRTSPSSGQATSSGRFSTMLPLTAAPGGSKSMIAIAESSTCPQRLLPADQAERGPPRASCQVDAAPKRVGGPRAVFADSQVGDGQAAGMWAGTVVIVRARPAERIVLAAGDAPRVLRRPPLPPGQRASRREPPQAMRTVRDVVEAGSPFFGLFLGCASVFAGGRRLARGRSRFVLFPGSLQWNMVDAPTDGPPSLASFRLLCWAGG